MFKTLFQNIDYEFDMNGNYKIKNEKEIFKNKFIDILLFGQLYRNISTEYLGLLAHYEVDIMSKKLFNITFEKCTSKVLNIKCGYLMVIKEPISIDKHFMIIPGFTRFAINVEGVVKSIKYNRVLKPSINAQGYPYVNLYDPDKVGDKWRSVCIHILLARTFIKNLDNQFRPFVNHKNGNKLDYRLINLEWVSSRYNNKHAINTGLRKDNIICFLKDLELNKIIKFNSIRDAFTYMGYSSRNPIYKIVDGDKKPIIFKNRFLFHNHNDESKKVDLTSKHFSLTNLLTNENIIFESLIKAAKFLDIDRRTFRNKLVKNIPVKNWIITRIK